MVPLDDRVKLLAYRVIDWVKTKKLVLELQTIPAANKNNMKIERSNKNPIISPDGNKDWESVATFNPSVASDGNVTHIVYRAVSPEQKVGDAKLELSTIGHAVSNDGVAFTDREQLIKPEHDWEKFGCEDPRITKFGDRYFIFYTALSRYPFSADGIKIGVASRKILRI